MANKIDFESLTLGEVATIEDLSGVPIATYSEQTPQGKFLAALVMVAKRRNGEPGFKFNDALALPMNDAHAYLGIGDDDEADDVEVVPEGKDEPFDESATS